MEQDILFGLWAVALGTVCVAVGMLTKGLARALTIQAKMLKCLSDLTGVIVTQGAHQVQAVPLPNWRELPPDARLMMRNSLIEVLREMDNELGDRRGY